MIWGNSAGIGFATVQRRSKAGHHTISLARSMPSGEFPEDVMSVNLADSVATGDAIKQILNNNQIDGVVNNVGSVRSAALGNVAFSDDAAFITGQTLFVAGGEYWSFKCVKDFPASYSSRAAT